MNVELFINNTLVETNDTIEWNITKTFLDVENPTSIFADYSKTINIPVTENNNKLFGNLFSIDRITAESTLELNTGVFFNPLKQQPCKLFINKELVLEGYSKVTEVTNEYYSINIIGQLGKIFNELSKYKFTNDTNTPYQITYLPAYYIQLYPHIIKSMFLNNQNPTTLGLTDCFGFYKAFTGHEKDVDETSFVKGYNKEDIDTFINTLTNKWGGTNKNSYSNILNSKLKNGLYWYEFQNQIKDVTVLSYVYCNKLIECYKHIVDTTTDYTLDLDKTFFNYQNPFFANYVYTLPFNINAFQTDYVEKIQLQSKISESFDIDSMNYRLNSYSDGSVNIDSSLETFEVIYSNEENITDGKTINIPTTYKVTDIEFNLSPKLKTCYNTTYYPTEMFSGNVILYNSAIKITVEIPNYNTKSVVYYANDLNKKDNYFGFEADYYVNAKNVTLGYLDIDNINEYTDYIDDSGTVRKYPLIELTLPPVKMNLFTDVALPNNATLKYKIEWSNKKDNNNDGTTIFEIKQGTKLESYNAYLYGFSETSDFNFVSEYNSKIVLNNIFGYDFYLQDWIIKYTKKFGLVWEIDYINKKIFIKTKDTYFSECSIEKLDEFTSDFKVLTTNTPYSKYVFKFKDDASNNSSIYKNMTNIDYGYLEVYTENTKDTEVKTLFDNENSNIVTKISSRNWNNMYNNEDFSYNQTNYYLPALFKGNNINTYEPVDVSNRYFFKLTNFSNITSFIISTLDYEVKNKKYYYLSVNNDTPESTVLDIKGLPCLSPVSSESDYKMWATYSVPIYDFAGLDYTINDTIYTAFWKNWLQFITNRKIIVVKTRINKPDLKKFYQIGNTLYVVDKINNYNYNTKEAELTLQQIDNSLPSFNPVFTGLYVQNTTIVAYYNTNFEPVTCFFEDNNTTHYSISVESGFYTDFLLEIDNKQYTTTEINLNAGYHSLRITALKSTPATYTMTITSDNYSKVLTIKNY